MTLTAEWAAATCAGLLNERAAITRVLPGGYKRTIGSITWAADGQAAAARPLIALTRPAVLDAEDLRNLGRLIRDAYTIADAVMLDEARDTWENSPEAAQTAALLADGEPPAETCILPAAWDPTDAITLTGRDTLDDALTQAAADTARAHGWKPAHTSKPWTVTWARI